jgi:dCMP deaminase
MGFNGFPKGIKDSPELYADREIKYKLVKHAEENACAFCRERVDGYTLYVYPFPPCASCAGTIIQHGIKRVVACVGKVQEERMRTDKTFNFVLTFDMFIQAGVKYDQMTERELDEDYDETGNYIG